MLQKFIELVKKQISFHEYRASSTKAKGDNGRNAHVLLKEQFAELLDLLVRLNQTQQALTATSIDSFLESLSQPHPSPTNGNVPDRKSGDLLPEDLDGLPDEILDKLGLRSSDRQEFLLIDIIKELGGAAYIPKIQIELYKRTGEMPERNAIGAKLYRMVSKEQIKSSTIGKGWYCLPNHESASDQQQSNEQLSMGGI
jgi:hypothetical protein